ncbi:MAG: hypothetical protein A2017_18240 [Lentisphaerae bacterium GWF2_44_16]|nr:MAG: hypothetical protein A2017_18240 [Lentisphaerae bacterium GWF2_44_16]
MKAWKNFIKLREANRILRRKNAAYAAGYLRLAQETNPDNAKRIFKEFETIQKGLPLPTGEISKRKIG